MRCCLNSKTYYGFMHVMSLYHAIFGAFGLNRCFKILGHGNSSYCFADLNLGLIVDIFGSCLPFISRYTIPKLIFMPYFVSRTLHIFEYRNDILCQNKSVKYKCVSSDSQQHTLIHSAYNACNNCCGLL